ncbi:MAG: hypothetical protein FWF96_01450 [Kiritimatiellaeota bacterium]|nr:hypothetical protein [Kiritimatiellota bacterium]
MKKTFLFALGLATGLANAATTNSVSGGGSALQDAIVAGGYDVLLVGPGIYDPIDTGNATLRIESVDGAETTIIDGGGTQRCVTLGSYAYTADTNTVLVGFTLRNGRVSETSDSAYGGGALRGTLIGCVLTNNTVEAASAGFTAYGGGAYGSLMFDCHIVANKAIGNAASSHGGGANLCKMTDCKIVGNQSVSTSGNAYGGGISQCDATGSVLADNRVQSDSNHIYGGGAYSGGLNRCVISGNKALGVVAGGGGTCNATLNNCLVIENEAAYGGGVSGGFLRNCTISMNRATATGSTAGGGITGGVTANNCIVVANVDGNNTFNNHNNSAFYSSCTTPNDNLHGNIDANPLFVDPFNDFRLQPTSPCIDAGDDTVLSGDLDLDGKPRILGVHMDMGAYEWQPEWYVNIQRPNDTGDGKSWATAKKTLQTAVNLTGFGDIIHVADGTYDAIGTANKSITIISENGATATTIDGRNITRCAKLDLSIVAVPNYIPFETNTVLIGFTLTRGRSTGSSANYFGGGVRGGTLYDCVISSNMVYSSASSQVHGGGAYGSVLNGCDVIGNTATNITSWSNGGGVEACVLNRCTVKDNLAASENSRVYGGGALNSVLNNCLIIGNNVPLSSDPNTYGGGVYSCSLVNCTVAGNKASRGAGVATSSGTEVISNCIVWDNYNTAGTLNNFYSGASGTIIRNTCSMPRQVGDDNIDDNPLFVNPTIGDYRLQSDSLCRGAGDFAFVFGAYDLDGNPRTTDGAVDMGAYQFFVLPSPADNIRITGFSMEHSVVIRNQLEITLPFEYDGSLDGLDVRARMWTQLGVGAGTTPDCSLVDNKNGTAVLTVYIQDTIPAAFFRVEVE